MIPRIALTAAFVLVAACGGNQPAAGGAGGAAQGGTSGIGGSAAAGSSAGQQSAGAGAGGTSAGSAGAGAAGGGAGGTAGAAGAGGAPTLVMPIERGDGRVLEFGDLVFEVKPAIGARITSLKLGGDELLTGPTENDRFYGSTLWTSPADDWVIGPFDPPAIVDRDPYTTTVSAEGVITAVSASSTANNKTFSVTKVFKADIPSQAIVIDYQLKNLGAAPFKLSHWEVTRVFPDGLSFFATGTSQKIDFLPQDMTLTDNGSFTWYDNKTHTAQGGESKAGAETPGGFIAHVVPNAKGPILFVKAFDDVAPNAAPTGHFEVELFCNNPHTYVELEDHSSFDDIAPGATYTQTVHWYVRRLPVGTPVTVGSAELIAAVNTVLGK